MPITEDTVIILLLLTKSYCSEQKVCMKSLE